MTRCSFKGKKNKCSRTNEISVEMIGTWLCRGHPKREKEKTEKEPSQELKEQITKIEKTNINDKYEGSKK